MSLGGVVPHVLGAAVTPADVDDFRRWLADAGEFIGLSAWTPKHGRFEVVSVK